MHNTGCGFEVGKKCSDMAKVAKWIEYKIPPMIVCSNCDYGTSVKEKKKLKKCPNCGAKMKGVK